jgi:hypothetical protein
MSPSRLLVRFFILVMLLVPVAAFAQSALPQTPTTTLTANVSEQATVTTPATITFTVNNISAPSASSASVSASNVVLVDGHSLKISLQANAANFTAPTGGTTTYGAGDVSWASTGWTNASGSAGTLSTSFQTVATCTANATGCSNGALGFSLAAHAGIDRAGAHSLVVTWKFESI